ncbi:MAG: VWA domain-containing protein [Acidobacteria bacterium]|nr:VWA domain-containing protein [Acidobacteriota bacterium]
MKIEIIRGLAAVVLSAAVISGPAIPQERKPPVKTPDPDDVTLGTLAVNLPVLVLDKHGQSVSGLQPDNFEVKEEGVPQTVRSVSTESDLPLALGVLMDCSNSVRPKLKFEQEAAMNFLDTVVRRRKDQALFVAFNTTVELLQDFTDDLEALRKAIYSTRASGSTSLYDAIYRVCEEKMHTGAARRALIAISDGEDNASEHTLDQAIDYAQRTETVVYCLGTANAGGFGVSGGVWDAPGNKELKKLADETGGKAYFPSRLIELERSFAEIGRELRSLYVVFYISTNQARDGKFREIDVKVRHASGTRTRAKRGYAAPRS